MKGWIGVDRQTSRGEYIGVYFSPRYTKDKSPGRDATIMIFDVPKGKEVPVGSYVADDIIQYVGARLAK